MAGKCLVNGLGIVFTDRKSVDRGSTKWVIDLFVTNTNNIDKEGIQDRAIANSYPY